MSDIPSWNHHNPVRIVCAPLETLAQHVKAHHVLLVTTPGFVKRGVVQRVKDILTTHLVTVWDGVKPNPDLRDLDVATASLRALEIGCVVGLGGGSALDAAKVLASSIPSPAALTLCQVFRGDSVTPWAPRLPLLAIPTTSGTGAEVTPFASVWDHKDHKKYSLSGDFVYPDVALLDPTLTLTLGEDDTLYPALDTISHALESLWNKNCTPVSRTLAYQALALSKEALPRVMKEPFNLKTRRDLQMASLLGGLAISQTRTAVAHAISYPLTTNFDVPHGLACSFTLEYLISINMNRLTESDQERLLLLETLEELRKFNLAEKISKYLNWNSISKNAIQFDSARSSNYFDEVTSVLVKNIIEKSMSER